jgi:anti-sigma factor RsiW
MSLQCREAEALIDPYADAELDLVRSLEVERHLAECPACARAHRELLLMRDAIQVSAPYYTPDPRLERRVNSVVSGSKQTGGKPPWMLAIAAVAILGLGAALWRQARSGPARDPVITDLLNNHVRSLMADHLVDVPSSDRHTVRPWYTGKLNYSPEVTDYSNQGFPLVGGRLDYAGGHAVAALVYRHDKHIVNLFVWPAAALSGSSAISVDGYNFEHWSATGMEYWAVSDMNPSELHTFAGLFSGK